MTQTRRNIEILDPRFESILRADTARTQVATGMAFTEGPVWVERDACVLFTDIPGNRIMRWHEQDGLSIYNANSHFAIGLYLDAESRLIACEHSTRCLTRYDGDGTRTVLAGGLGDYVLNSTNDVCVRASDGAVFFTDPPFGVRAEDGSLHGYQQAMEYGYCGVFKVTDNPMQPGIVTNAIYRPNGLCFSPDEKTLYVSDSSERYHHIHALTLNAGDEAVSDRVFAVLPNGVPDGMRVDSEDRLYVAGLDGIYVYLPDGTLLGKLLVPEMVTNLCFGGSDRRTLFITAVSSLYAFNLAAVGIQKP